MSSTDFNDFTGFTDFTNLPVFTLDVENDVLVNCDFIDIENLHPFISCLSLSILMLNVRSLKRNFNVILSEFCNYFKLFSIIAFTETWLTGDRDKGFNIPGFYSLNLYRNQNGGGLRLYIKECFRARILQDFTFLHDSCEILTLALDISCFKYVVMLVYHPPTSSVQKNIEFVDLFTLKLKAVKNLNMPVLVAGDFNLNLFNPSNFTYIDLFINNMLELSMTPLITRPTRVWLANGSIHYSLLDQIWASVGISRTRSFIFPLSITDHLPVCTVIEIANPIISTSREIETRVFSEANKETFRILFNSLELILTLGNFNLVFTHFYNSLFLAYDAAFPIMKKKIQSKVQAPWMTVELKKCIQKKNRLYKLQLKGKIQKTVYTAFRNQLTRIIRRVKALYYARLFLENSNDPKKVWDILNGIISNRNRVVLDEILVNNVKIRGRKMVNHINEFFINIAMNIRNGQTYTQLFRCLAPNVTLSCFFWPTDILEMKRVIVQLKNKGNRLLDIHPLIVKDNIEVFADHLVVLYNLSLQKCVFPDPLKIARVAPAYKSGDPWSIDNYRPISSLPVLSKLFERLTLNRMLSFIYNNSILSPNQFGFRKGHNVTQAVAKLTTHIIQAFHSKIYCACFFLDLRKAFDTVSHNLLFVKLHHYGFRGQCQDYLRSYFSNRKQYVHVGGVGSESGSVVCGVPQGSILGPICFSLFINDLPLSVKVDVVLFADDAAFVITCDTFGGLIDSIKELFVDLADYLNMNQLVPNSNKSKLMFFKSRPSPTLPDISFHGTNIEWVNEYKYLGIMLTSTMSFAKHINIIASKVSQVTGTFSNLRNFVPLFVLKKLYYALVYPHLNAGILVWGAAPVSHLRPLRVRINNLLRTMLCVTWDGGVPSRGTLEIFSLLSLLNLSSIFKLNLFKFLKQILDGNLPIFYNLLMARYETPHNYRTRRIGFRCPNVTCEVERRGLSYQLVKLLEELPEGLVNLSINLATGQFKRALLSGQ